MSIDMNQILDQKVWAVIGVSNDHAKYGYKVYIQLKNAGYSVYAVNPKLITIDGDPCYPSLASVPSKPDVVSVVVPPNVTEQIVRDCIDLGITNVWMQPGSESPEAIRNGEKNGLTVIHNQCVLILTRDKVL
jgi:Predicted CoA-binding protein